MRMFFFTIYSGLYTPSTLDWYTVYWNMLLVFFFMASTTIQPQHRFIPSEKDFLGTSSSPGNKVEKWMAIHLTGFSVAISHLAYFICIYTCTFTHQMLQCSAAVQSPTYQRLQYLDTYKTTLLSLPLLTAYRCSNLRSQAIISCLCHWQEIDYFFFGSASFALSLLRELRFCIIRCQVSR